MNFPNLLIGFQSDTFLTADVSSESVTQWSSASNGYVTVQAGNDGDTTQMQDATSPSLQDASVTLDAGFSNAATVEGKLLVGLLLFFNYYVVIKKFCLW
jgi:hypothetical protein